MSRQLKPILLIASSLLITLGAAVALAWPAPDTTEITHLHACALAIDQWNAKTLKELNARSREPVTLAQLFPGEAALQTSMKTFSANNQSRIVLPGDHQGARGIFVHSNNWSYFCPQSVAMAKTRTVWKFQMDQGVSTYMIFPSGGDFASLELTSQDPSQADSKIKPVSPECERVAATHHLRDYAAARLIHMHDLMEKLVAQKPVSERERALISAGDELKTVLEPCSSSTLKVKAQSEVRKFPVSPQPKHETEAHS